MLRYNVSTDNIKYNDYNEAAYCPEKGRLAVSLF